MQTKQVIFAGLLFNLTIITVVYTLVASANEELFYSLITYGSVLLIAGIIARRFIQKTLVMRPSRLDRNAAGVMLVIEVLSGVICLSGYLYLLASNSGKGPSWPFIIPPLLMGSAIGQLWYGNEV